MNLQQKRQELFELLQKDQGWGFVSDTIWDGDCALDLVEYVEQVAYHMQSAANKARGFANQLRRELRHP